MVFGFQLLDFMRLPHSDKLGLSITLVKQGFTGQAENIYPSTYKEQKRGENTKDLRKKFEKF